MKKLIAIALLALVASTSASAGYSIWQSGNNTTIYDDRGNSTMCYSAGNAIYCN